MKNKFIKSTIILIIGGAITKVMAMIIRLPQSPIFADLLAIVIYLLYNAAVIAFLVSLYWLIWRISPKLAAVLSGGRS